MADLAKAEAPKTGAQPPVDHVRQGNLEAAIWANVTDRGTFYSATFVRKYQVDGESGGKPEWRQTSSFNERDLPALSKLMNDTHTRIQELKAQGA